jgi:hypothetical protein
MGVMAQAFRDPPQAILSMLKIFFGMLKIFLSMLKIIGEMVGIMRRGCRAAREG